MLLDTALKVKNDLSPGKNPPRINTQSQQQQSQPPQLKLADPPKKDAKKKSFTTTFETIVPATAEVIESVKNNGNLTAPLATIDIDADIIDKEEGIEQAVVKIQAGVRGYLTRKNLRQVSMNDQSTHEPTTPVIPADTPKDEREYIYDLGLIIWYSILWQL